MTLAPADGQAGKPSSTILPRALPLSLTMPETPVSAIDDIDLAAAETASDLTGGRVALLASLAAIGSLATNIILPAFPEMADSFGVGTRDLGVMLSSFFVAFAVGQLVIGPLSDRYGRRRLVLGGLVVFFVGSLVCASAVTMAMLIVGRVVQALGVCAAAVLARAIARDLFDGEVLARALSLTMVATAAAPGFSPLVGSTLDALFGWRILFILVGAAGIAIALFYAYGIGETHPADLRSAATVRGVAGAYRELLGDARFVRPALAVSLVIGGLFAFFAGAPAILMGTLALSATQLGLFFAATVFVVFGAGLLAPRLAHHFGAGRVALTGILVALAGGVILMAAPGGVDVALVSVAIAVFLSGMGLVNPLGTAIAMHPFGEQAGLASALLGFLQMVCAAIGAGLGAMLPFSPAAALSTVLVGGCALALVAFVGHRH